ncbi:hypothetical protein LF1_57570 [Rubripirellula obstinata]|uniref:Uncharacterized protein n=1 Tax=Rubripirellula obstinata TaxID=406547 RepID=A0A5B1CBC7_9BACT|nr:hypothetical protein [Rubripirellula obstinata]KAA1256949.1 hypothetical protein LF1_57570 [Rubripirellula obstinata]
MSDFEPVDLQRMPDYTRFEDASGLEYEVYGGESRLSVAFEIAANSTAVVKLAEGLIRSFIKFDGVYAANHCEVLASPEDDGSVSLIRYSFESASDPHEFGYTYYDVYVALRDPPSPRFHPTKFVVGFW